MATLTVTLTGQCAGGDHLTFAYSGAATGSIVGYRDDMTNALTDDEKRAFVAVLCKLAKIGRTNAQAVALLQAGVTVTV